MLSVDDFLVVIGFAALVGGVALVEPTVALIVGGALLIIAGLVGVRGSEAKR